ncbi:hypothetical protein MUN89_17615 [Halobacillus salinarum]|uniref:Uncharacterized protein n=1 Tax=Halobacillus salinarum TaxID=2932257 RepID=A0ABY4EHR1_9BACI|nr:hypothetical protein [Halobacillus salinarum]UOQ43684.1 hypothetical protein MUN89_17615 [Halobacillus salinarum]
MAKHVEAYFHTENDAESAKADLQSLEIEHEFIEAIPDDRDLNTIVPVGGSSQFGGTANISSVMNTKDIMDDPDGHLTHLLQFEVDEDRYEEALSIIKQHMGHMDQDHL